MQLHKKEQQDYARVLDILAVTFNEIPLFTLQEAAKKIVRGLKEPTLPPSGLVWRQPADSMVPVLYKVHPNTGVAEEVCCLLVLGKWGESLALLTKLQHGPDFAEVLFSDPHPTKEEEIKRLWASVQEWAHYYHSTFVPEDE